MTAGHLITNRNLSLLGNIYTNRLVDTWCQLVSVLSCKYFNSDYDTIFAVRNLKRCISYFSCFLTKDSSKKSLLSCKFCLSLRSNLTYKNISGTNLSTDADNTIFIKILDRVSCNRRNISCNLFWS